jgi:hypothetical protein
MHPQSHRLILLAKRTIDRATIAIAVPRTIGQDRMRKKRKAKKQSWSTSYTLEVDPDVLKALEEEDTPEAQLSLLAMHVAFDSLETVTVDAKRRQLIWPDGKRLSLIESAARIHSAEPELPQKLIESKIISWLESFAPQSYTREQLDELDRLTEEWIDEHCRQYPMD